MLKPIERRISFPALKEELRKVGVNFITAGVVGVFVYHYVGTNPESMLKTSISVTVIGSIALYFGIKKRGEKQ